MSYGEHRVDCTQMFPRCPCNHCEKDNARDKRGNRCCGLRVCSSMEPCPDFRQESPKEIGRKPEAFGYSAAMREQEQVERALTQGK